MTSLRRRLMPNRGYGPKDAKIMVVGEAYGRNEKQKNRPFVGAAGGVLREVLMKSGIDPESIYYTNLINDQPPGNNLYKWWG
jgi:uracil-DNA glycosylase family 4